MHHFGSRRIFFVILAGAILLPLAAQAEVIVKDQPQANSTTPSEIAIRWNAPIGAEGLTYRIYRNGDLAGETTRISFTDSGLASNTSYAYAIKVVNGSGAESAFSPFVIAKTLPGIPGDLVPPQAPTWQTAVPVSTTAAQLSWNPAKDNVFVAGYKVFRNDLLATTTTQTNFRDTDLTPSIAYSYTVVAFDLAGNVSPRSEIRNVTTLNSLLTQDKEPPTQPVGLTAKLVGAGQVDLAWTKSTDNVAVTAYRVYRNHQMLTTIPDANYSDFSVEPTTSYSYTVVAYDGAGNTSQESVVASITTGAFTGVKPNPPTDISVTYDNRQVMLKWTDASNNETSFAIERRRVGDSTWVRVSSVGANMTSFSDTGALAGKYEYRVLACASECAAGASSKPVEVGSAPDADLGHRGSTVAPPAILPALSRTLSRGMKGPDVMLLQQILVYENLLPDSAPSGYFGGDTEKAVTAFQNKYAAEVLKPADLKVGNGVVGELTRKKLNSFMAAVLGSVSAPQVAPVSQPTPITSSTPVPASNSASVGTTFTHTLRRGMQSQEVLALQIVLVNEGLMDVKAPNGFFGEGTYKAVVAFQNKYAAEVLLPADLKEGNGIVGELTRKKLNSFIKP